MGEKSRLAAVEMTVGWGGGGGGDALKRAPARARMVQGADAGLKPRRYMEEPDAGLKPRRYMEGNRMPG